MAGTNTKKINAVAKAGAKKAAGKKTTTKRKKSKMGKSTKPSFSTYIYRVLKETHPRLGITKQSMAIMNDFVVDMMDQIAAEAKQDLSLGKERTLREWHMNTATKLVLPGELQKHGVSEGTKAITNFNAHRKSE